MVRSGVIYVTIIAASRKAKGVSVVSEKIEGVFSTPLFMGYPVPIM